MYVNKRTINTDDINEIMSNLINKVLYNGNNGTCALTGTHYDNYGNNAYPFEGRCCDAANERYVVPARMMGITPELIQKYSQETILKFIDAEYRG